MLAKLVATRGSSIGREELLVGETAIIGRSETCQIVVRDEQVSRRHAELSLYGGQWHVRDLNSVNGTFVNGRRLVGDERIPLPDGGHLQLGPNVEFVFQETKTARAPEVFGPQPATASVGERSRIQLLPIALGVAGLFVLAVLVFLAWRGIRQDRISDTRTSQTAELQVTGMGGAETTQPPIVTREVPRELALPTVTARAITLPTVPVPPIPQATAARPPAAAPASIGLEQLPQIIAAAFPGVPADQLPAAIEQAIRSGQVTPNTAKLFIETLFPGIPPTQLPAALAGSFAGFNGTQIQGILKAVFPDQTIPIPKLDSREGQVVFAALDQSGHRFHIYQMNADATDQRILIEDASEPAFSPDGNRLAYFSWRSDAVGLHIRNLVTGEDRVLTGNDNDAYPSWSPDGSRLAFWDTSNDTILTINADGTDRRAIGRGQFPAWSPRGDRIAIKGCVSSNCGIVLINPDGSNPIRITTNANDGQPAWSPDGRSIAFVSNRDGNWEIYVVNADGSWLRRVTNDIHTDGLPAWAPDGIRIAFRSDRSGKWAIYTVTGVGGPPFRLTDAPVQTEGLWQWTWEKITWR